MKVFIGKISEGLREEEVRGFFGSFGEISDFNFKGSYAFVEYRDDSVAQRVLENRDYNIGDYTVFVEESVGRKRQRFDSNVDDYQRRPPAYDDYPSNGRQQYNGGYDSYGSRAYNDRAPPSHYDDRRVPDSYRPRHPGDYPPMNYPPMNYPPMSYPPRDPREDCPHCSRCEVHGNMPRREGYSDFDKPKRPKRDHPNDVNKFVIESLPSNISINEVEDFVRNEGFDIVFSRLTARGDAAIVELRDIESKEDAINKLQGKEINGSQISTRNFRTNVSNYNQNDTYNSERRNESHGDLYGGIDSVNVD